MLENSSWSYSLNNKYCNGIILESYIKLFFISCCSRTQRNPTVRHTLCIACLVFKMSKKMVQQEGLVRLKAFLCVSSINRFAFILNFCMDCLCYRCTKEFFMLCQCI